MNLQAVQQDIPQVTPKLLPMGWVYLMFFFSGCPALIYQIIWQRALFSIYGVNIQSVTVVVSAFMLGLGVGSLLGGFVSKRPKAPLLAIFGVAEIGIAIFGMISLRLFEEVGLFTAGAPTMQTGLITFGLVVIPTTLMGGTLPLLTAYLVRRSGHVGNSVGTLYFVNTLGSATACFVAAQLTMRTLGMSGSVAVAAVINAAIGTGVLMLSFRKSGQVPQPSDAENEATGLAGKGLMPFPLAVLVAGLAGFISLSYEIIWYRMVSYISGGEAKSFSFLLGWFLAGIAFGSLLSRRLCGYSKVDGPRTARIIAGLIVAANLVGFLIIPFFGEFVRHFSYLLALPLIGVAAGLLGAMFPLICHVAVPPDGRVGARLSYLYLSNILGSASGSLLVGLVLMNFWGVREISVMLALIGLALGASLMLVYRGRRTTLAAAALAGLALAVVAFANPLFAGIYDKFQNKGAYQTEKPFKYVVESRSGVITVDDTDTIYGGGAYDGKFSTDLVHDSNNVVRTFAISSFHPAPKQVLMIGLSSGSWAQILANHPQIEKLTIVEINPAYTDVIEHYPIVKGVLRNPKVELVIDDGRRWLVRSPDRKFDVIVMNTSFAWRANISNLLSADFLGIVRKHLNPGGIHFYNTTQFGEAQLTGATVFPYALRVLSFMAVSDSPIVVDKERWRKNLIEYRIEGKPVLDLANPAHQKRLDEVLGIVDSLNGLGDDAHGMESGESVRRRHAGKSIITDDNMGIEWRKR
jgi:spermidine synthase